MDSKTIETQRESAVAARAATRRRVRRRRLVLAAIAAVLLAAGGGGWFLWQNGQAHKNAYVTVAVEYGDVEDSVTALGNLQPLNYVDVGTQVSGQLRKLYFDLGRSVQQGELLAEIDPTVYLARVEASKAQLLNLRAQLADKQAQQVLAEQQFQRQSELMKVNATSREALQSAEASMRSAAAQVESIKAQIQQTESTLRGDEANLGYTKIYAPINGTVVSQSARQGQTLNANQQAPIIYTVADLSTMTVWTQVSEADVSRLRVGMDAYFTTLGQPNRRWHGKLRQILPTPEVDNNVVLYNALFDVPNPDRELMTQMSAHVFFVVASAKNVPVVPMAALQQRGRDRNTGTRFIARVLGPDGNAEERAVTVGVRNRVSAEIKSGLEIGDRVIIGRSEPAGRPAPSRPSSRPARLS